MRLLMLLPFVIAATSEAQPAWRIDRAPAVAVRASAPDGSVQFAHATWAVRLSTGVIAIADGMEGTIRIAAADGRVVRTMGRAGNGPGEFRDLTWIGRCAADSLYAWDMQSARVSVFDAVNGYARQFVPAGTASSMSASCSPSGEFAAMTMPGQGGSAAAEESGSTSQGGQYEVRRMMAGVLLTEPSGAETGRISGVLWGEMIAGRVSSTGGIGAMPRPLGGRTWFAFMNKRLVVGRSDSARVEIFESHGARVGAFAIGGNRAAPSAAQYERAISPAIAAAPPRMHEILTSFAKAVPAPARRPAFSRLLVDPSDLIWLVISLDGDPVTRLRAYRASGAALATLELPIAMSVFEIGVDYVLGRVEDASGDQSVVLHRFTRR